MYVRSTAISPRVSSFQNLQELSDGLEGRAKNPVALFVDQMCHPYADTGRQLPSQMKWLFEPDRAVEHVVIGKAAKPGGVWQVSNLTGNKIEVLCCVL